MIRIVPYSPEHFEAARRFFDRIHGRRDATWHQWRLGGPPGVTTWLAFVDCEVGASISTMLKPYRLDDDTLECGEIFDWVALPELRRRGLGIMLLQRVMQQQRPIINLGGSEDTRRLLPKLKWLRLAQPTVFALPLSGRFIHQKLSARPALAALGARAFDLGKSMWFHARRRVAPSGWRALMIGAFDERLVQLYHQARFHHLVAAPDPVLLDWATASPAASGRFLRFYFVNKGVLGAWGLARMVDHPGGERGEIVDLFAAKPDVAVYRWAISEMTAALAHLGVDGIVTTASCPLVKHALRSQRFLSGPRQPLYAFWPGRAPSGRPIHIMRGTADHFILSPSTRSVVNQP